MAGLEQASPCMPLHKGLSVAAQHRPQGEGRPERAQLLTETVNGLFFIHPTTALAEDLLCCVLLSHSCSEGQQEEKAVTGEEIKHMKGDEFSQQLFALSQNKTPSRE